MPKRASHSALRLIHGLKLSFGIIAMAVVYAAVVTPALVKIIQRNKRPVDREDEEALEVEIIEMAV